MIALVGLEFGVRHYLPTPPPFPQPEHASLIIPPSVWDTACWVLHGPEGVDGVLQSLHRKAENRSAPPDHPPTAEGPLVIHLGDSMTYGDGFREAEAFPALLNQLQPERVHVNDGIWAVGNDFQYLLLHKVLAVQRPLLVVVHVYVGNDIYEIDRPYECCESGPLLEYSAGGPRAGASV